LVAHLKSCIVKYSLYVLPRWTAIARRWIVDERGYTGAQMRLLISNDDGIFSAGLALLARVARKYGEVVVVAPDNENSSASHSISSSRPLSYRRASVGEGIEAYRVNGTPADCVALGMFHHGDVEVVLSGVNNGPNLGNAIWHSGTMAAARQGALLGARGIALSTPSTSEDAKLEGLAQHIEAVLDLLLPRADLRLVNVNIPPAPRGIQWVREAIERYDGEIVPANDPYGRPIYWLTVTQLKEHREGTDLWAFERGYIAITPLTLDITATEVLNSMSAADRVTEFPQQPAAVEPIVAQALMREAESAGR
jgi:5'-nucleotidase